LTGAPSLTVSLIEGGSDICTVPARCVVTIDRRLVPGETPGEAVEEVNRLLAGLTTAHPEILVRSITPAIENYPVNSDLSEPLVQVTQAVCRQFGGSGRPHGVSYGTDASELVVAGIPCVVIGPGSIAQAHATDEFVEIEQLDRALEVYRAIMLSY
jgi:acetylornithine deacetylase